MSLGRISQRESGYSSIDTISLSMDNEDDTTCDSQQSTIKSIDLRMHIVKFFIKKRCCGQINSFESFSVIGFLQYEIVDT